MGSLDSMLTYLLAHGCAAFRFGRMNMTLYHVSPKQPITTCYIDDGPIPIIAYHVTITKFETAQFHRARARNEHIREARLNTHERETQPPQLFLTLFSTLKSKQTQRKNEVAYFFAASFLPIAFSSNLRSVFVHRVDSSFFSFIDDEKKNFQKN